MIRLEDSLVLNRYFHRLLGADSFAELKSLLRQVPEGPASDGQSHFFSRLATQPALKAAPEALREYDRRILGYEARLDKARPEFRGFRYFQYLALLYTEMMLDRLTSDPAALLAELNRLRNQLVEDRQIERSIGAFEADDLRRLAFFMATGSGKTLLLHVNVWQMLYYLEHGPHPETLVRRPDGRREFDNVLLITPNEGLSDQHIRELRASGMTDADHFLADPHGQRSLFGPKVRVIEIHKLAEEASRDGVSVVLKDFGNQNLILVDEGHKGTGTEARVWKTRQQDLSANGFLLEYSATFAQAIGAASRKVQDSLLAEYGKSILFDYSYAHFYGDGYGKNFRVLNLSRGEAIQAHALLVGGLLVYYEQFSLFGRYERRYRPYNIARPLWVMLGSSVNAVFTKDKQRRSDVAEVVSFLKRLLEDRVWAEGQIGRLLQGRSGFTDEAGNDLFRPCLSHLRGREPGELYADICRDVFHGQGALEVWELKNAEGELALRVSTGSSEDGPYFGIINIGDVGTFKKYLAERMGMEAQEDRFAHSQFEQVDRPDSGVNLLIGAKKFIEGWSSWRVSSMGLLNVGKGEGSQVIQLFGRGVRLKGRDMSLKRTEASAEPGSHPEGIRTLETLHIFGWNADYIRTFREMLEREDLGREFAIPVVHFSPWPEEDLPVPQKHEGFDTAALTWTLDIAGPKTTLDLTPRLQAVDTQDGTPRIAESDLSYGAHEVSFREPGYAGVLNQGRLYTELLRHKRDRGYHNTFISHRVLLPILQERCLLRMSGTAARSPERVQAAAEQLLKSYLDRFVRQKEREAEGRHVGPVLLHRQHPAVTAEYRVRVRRDGLLDQIERLLRTPLSLTTDEVEPLPRFHLDWHLFNPLLREGGREWKRQVSVRPPALVPSEAELVRDLRDFWRDHSQAPPFRDCAVYLLRNLPGSGIGLFRRSGFYPDFILWLKDKPSGAIHVRFLDPHGLHHGGLDGSADKFEALKSLAELSRQPDFSSRQITLDGFILANTPVAQIPDAGGRDWPALERDLPLMRQEGDYAGKLLTRPEEAR